MALVSRRGFAFGDPRSNRRLGDRGTADGRCPGSDIRPLSLFSRTFDASLFATLKRLGHYGSTFNDGERETERQTHTYTHREALVIMHASIATTTLSTRGMHPW